MIRGQQPVCPVKPSHISVLKGSFSSQPGVEFHLRNFTADLVPLGQSAPACFGKMTVVSRGEIFVTNESLTQLFSAKLGTTESKIKDLKVQNGVEKVTLSGKISKVIPIDFTVRGPVTTDGSLILLHAETIKADGLPIKGLLAMVGEHLNAVLALKGVAGIAVHEDVLSFSPEQVAHLKGRIDSVVSTERGLTLRMSKEKKPVSSTKSAGAGKSR